jgi:hypothetical protein
MTRRNRIPFGVTFIMTLVLSWTLMTTAIAAALYSNRDGSVVRLATWASLWLFSVVVPTMNAFAIHRAAGELTDDGPAGAAAADRLARLRPLLLLSANMALLSAFALIFGR